MSLRFSILIAFSTISFFPLLPLSVGNRATPLVLTAVQGTLLEVLIVTFDRGAWILMNKNGIKATLEYNILRW